MTRSRTIFNVSSLLVVIYSLTVSACNSSQLQLYSIELQESPELIEMKFEEKPIYAYRNPIILKKNDLTSIAVENSKSQSSVAITFSPEGVEKIQKFTISGTGKLAAIVLNKEVLYVARISEPLKNREVIITGFESNESAQEVVNKMKSAIGLVKNGERPISNEIFIGTESYVSVKRDENTKFIIIADQASINDITNEVTLLINDVMKEMKYTIVDVEELKRSSYENLVFLTVAVNDFETNRMTIEINGGILFYNDKLEQKLSVSHIWRGVFGIETMFFNSNKRKCIRNIVEHYNLTDMRTSEYW